MSASKKFLSHVVPIIPKLQGPVDRVKFAPFHRVGPLDCPLNCLLDSRWGVEHGKVGGGEEVETDGVIKCGGHLEEIKGQDCHDESEGQKSPFRI